MTPDAQRLTICDLMGFKGCTDVTCSYRKCQHLHRGGVVFFPEWYSTSRYPDYPNDLSAMNIVEKVLDERNLWDVYERELEAIWRANEQGRLQRFKIHASSKVRCEAMIKTLKLWKD